MEDRSNINKFILKCAYITIIVLIIAVIALLILKYEVEGERNMPFKLSSILVISNAEGYQKEENREYKWDVEIYQNNDIYLNIEKNNNYKDVEVIKSIKIENIKIDKKPLVGDVEVYRVANKEGTLFSYNEEYKINDSVEYIGDINSDLKDLKISNQGGTLIFRILNKTGKNYTSNDKEFEHSGKLLEKVNLSKEDTVFNITFDLVISLESDIAFRANIKLELPVGNISGQGASTLEITDMKNIVFKREQI